MAVKDFALHQLPAEDYNIAYDASRKDYPAPETMLSAMKERCESAPHLFLGYFADNKLVCYITASQSDKPDFTEECVTSHTPGGETVILHRIWVHKDYRMKGMGRKLFQKFKARVQMLNPQPRRICLAAEEKNITMFTKLGFTPKGGTLLIPFYEVGDIWHTKMECSLEEERNGFHQHLQ